MSSFGLILFCSLLFLQDPPVKSKQVKFPREFVKFLHKAGIPLGSVLRRNRLFHLPGVSAISAPRYDATSRPQAMSDTPEHSNGVITTQLNNLPYIPSESHCKPRPVAFRIPKSVHVRTYPDYVILNRCTGSCTANQETQHCAVTAQDAINVKIFEIVGDQPYITNTVIYNHTACGCDCITKESDCDPQKQTWNENTCGCDCIASANSCAANQKLDDKKCVCKCNEAEKHCDHVHKVWDTTNCGCHCKAILQDHCAAQNQLINSTTCECNSVHA
ncbi:unnamed protein product [Pocillopora meandrina]|uniref:Platelet-derived growth factor (PDGF) family profile domain-containing protein n=1 Tax=Pocillopora meandrina TaxID=46732 RepID=A0AAU9XFC6_9CNID|nr:unnamed protein product [Pocillopora meandrina]